MVTTISCDDTTKERFDDLRPTSCDSAGEFLDLLLTHYDEGEVTAEASDDYEVIIEELDEIKAAVTDDSSNEMQLDATDIIGRIEDLEAALPKKVADELGAGR